MKRRTFLTTATATLGIGSVAGCLADGDTPGNGSDGTGTDDPTGTETPTQSPTETPTETPTATPQSPSIESKNLEPTGDCSDVNTASVVFEDPEVLVTGCIQGPNGCHQPVLKDATVADGTLEVVVTTEKQGGDVCTQALVQRKYEATITFDGGLPSSVTVVHDSMGERTTVTTADR